MDRYFISACILSFLFISGINGQQDENDQCTITIWYKNSDVTGQTINVREGEQVKLMCDARCIGPGYTPVLKWGMSNHMFFQDDRGRVFTVNSNSNRLQTLYFRGFTKHDIGDYMCRGWIGNYSTAHVTIRLDSSTGNFENLLFRRPIQ